MRLKILFILVKAERRRLEAKTKLKCHKIKTQWKKAYTSS